MGGIPISEAESAVMAVLWQRQPLAADEVMAALAGQQDWQEATVKSLLSRLLNKGAISAVKEGRRYLYTPVLQREQWLQQESEGFLDRLFGGSLAPFVAHFGKHRKLSQQEVAELKKLIAEMGDDQ